MSGLAWNSCVRPKGLSGGGVLWGSQPLTQATGGAENWIFGLHIFPFELYTCFCLDSTVWLDSTLKLFCASLWPLQDELDSVYDVWNRHRIRRTRHELHVAGRPNVMYTNPELFDRSDYLQQVSDNDVQFCMQQCTMRSSIPCDGDVFDICCEVMAEEGVSGPKTVQEAVDVYLLLRNKVAALYWLTRTAYYYFEQYHCISIEQKGVCSFV